MPAKRNTCYIILLIIWILNGPIVSFAQQKKHIDTSVKNTSFKKKPDTIIYRKIEAPPLNPYAAKRDTIFPVSTTTQKIITKPGGKKQDIEIIRISPDSLEKLKKAIAAGVRPTEPKSNDKKIPIVMDTGYCACVQLTVKAQDSMAIGDYLSYTFTFKNTCKSVAYIHSASFRFVPFSFFGQKVRVLRKAEFTKRFDLPEFVAISPNETYTFKFADDAFFEYDLKRGEQYKFSFIHNNINQKYRGAPEKTYLCVKFVDKMIFVK